MGIKSLCLLSSGVRYNSQRVLQKHLNVSVFKLCHHFESCGIKQNSTGAPSVKITEKGKSLDESSFSGKLVEWAIQNKISYAPFSKLLVILSEYGIRNLPRNSRTLLKAKENEIKETAVPPGVYTHFGLENNLRNLIPNLVEKNLLNKTDIGISIFIDNLPLSNLTNRGLWVILGSIHGFPNNIFFIGAYQGASRPKSSNLFLSEFVTEAKDLCSSGLDVNGVNYNVKIERLICDAPAKAFILNIKDFTGYSSCTKCKTVGKYRSSKICFSEKSNLRTDKDFQSSSLYQREKTNLLEIPGFGIVSNVTLDYMHLVCLGVVKKIMTIWLTDDKHWICENAASELIKNLHKTKPTEFHNKPKTLKIFTRWNASQFREFLLYYGPVALKNNLKKEYYDHFLLLHVACRLLCSEATPENISRGSELLNCFVEEYRKLYKKQITHNFHGLYHLADECTLHGTLDNFSSFPFEKFLIKLRNSMRKTRKKCIPKIILTKSYKGIFTRNLSKLTGEEYKAGKRLKSEDLEQFEDFSYCEKLSLRNFEIIPGTEGDKYVLLKNGKIITVTNILVKKGKSDKTFLIAGKEFSSVCNFHSEPFDSLPLNMFKVGDVSNEVKHWPVDVIDKKCMKIPCGSGETVMVTLLDENF